jgi:hypothetical protein
MPDVETMTSVPATQSRKSSGAKAAAQAALGVAIGLVLFAVADLEFVKDQVGWNRTRNQHELMSLHEAITLGSTHQDVRATIAQPSFRHLQLYVENLPANEWWVHTPLEFGAGNWILGLQFEDGRLSATRVRVADGDFHPSGAPPDRGQWKGR